MTLEDRYLAIRDDPARRARAFKIIVIASYSMMMIGFAVILWVLYKQFT